jgi:uncharacterized repeat protein (TIGR02059 family)
MGILAVSGLVVVGGEIASAAAPAAPAASTIAVGADGTTVSMTFTQDLHPNIAPKEQFTVLIGTYGALTTRTVDVPVTAVTRTTARIITLSLGGVIENTMAPSVTYTAPPIEAGTDNLALQNNLGEDVASFSVVSTGTKSLVPGLASTLPQVLAAGNTLQLTYSLALAAAPALPAPSAFTVVVGGSTQNPVVAVTRPTTTTVLLTLRDGIEAGSTVTVSYAAPPVDNASATNPAIQGTAGNDAVSFHDVTVTNTASLVPKLTSAAVLAAGNVIELTFNQTLATTTAPPTAFQVTHDGKIMNVVASAISGTKAVLTLQYNVSVNQTVRVSYTAPLYDIAPTNTAIQRATTGQDALSFVDYVVGTNNSGAPYVVSASTSTNGQFIYLDYNEALHNNSSLHPRFVVKVNGVTKNLSNARWISSTRYELTMSTTAEYIERDLPVEVSYTPNSWDSTTANSVIQDSGGTDAPPFVDLPVTNNSTRDVTPPTVVSAEVGSDGLSISVTYSEPLSLSIGPTNLAARFTLLVDGVSRTFSGVSVPTSTNGQPSDQIILFLSEANKIDFGQSVKLGYNQGSNNTGSVRDPRNNYKLSMSDFDVTNDDKTRAAIRGTVFNDFNSNGLFDSTVVTGQAQDIGVGGIVVRAFDPAGVKIGETTTNADGTYRLPVTSDGVDVRVEFVLPTSGPLAALEPSFATSTESGVKGSTTVQFVTLDPSADVTGVNLAVNVPGEYCQSNPHLVISRLCAGKGAVVDASPSIFVTRYDGGPYDTSTASTDAFTNWGSNTAATKLQTGSILGMAYDPAGGRVYNSAYVRRHAEMYEIGGVPRPGAIFVTTPNGTRSGQGTGGTTEFLVDLETLLSGQEFSDGNLPTNAQRRLDCIFYITATSGTCTTTTGWDTTVGNLVGRVGIGDIETDGKKLWVVSLHNRDLYEVDLPSDGSTPTTMRSLGSPTTGVPCTNGIARPFSVRLWRGSLYAGVVCDGQNDFNSADPWAIKDANLSFTIQRFDLVTQTWSTFYGPHPLNSTGYVTKGWAANNWADRDNPISRRWNPWVSNFHPSAAIGTLTRAEAEARFHNRPVPMLTEIEFDRDGSMVLGFRDRTGDITSTVDSWSMSGGRVSYPSTSSGDIYRVCRVGTGYSASDYKFEGSHSSCVRKADSGNGTEYYNADAWVFGTGTIGHGEISAGMLLTVPGFPDTIMTAYDPFSGDSNGVTNFYTGGIRYLRNSSGGATGYPNNGSGVMVYSSDPPLDVGPAYDDPGAKVGGFMKVNGMSDIEALCDQAPVQIGNRVWIDENKDGIQDPGEPPLAGVTVRLYSADGTLVGTAVTDENGQYFFSSEVSESVSGNGDHIGGGLTIDADFVIRLDNPNDYLSTGPLSSYVLTASLSTSTSESMSTSVDSDATMEDGWPSVVVSPLSAGANDHTFDIGFFFSPVEPRVSVGDLVWLDTNRDGLRDIGEPGLAGVTVSITTADGLPVTDVFGNPVTSTVTDANGVYMFENLPVGSYTVTVVTPDGYIATLEAVGSDRGADSSTGSATSADLLNDGSSDRTLDFGFVLPMVSVGDFVWLDTNRDGIQDDGELGIAGVTLTVTNADGSAVIDVFGNAVTTTTTSASGFYLFENLPPGTYVVTVTDPVGFIPTISGAGTPVSDSATGSATSSALTVDGDSDLTLDFGFVVPMVSVGDFVWLDTDRDGIQDFGEPGIAGVTVSITTADGSPVTNVFGQPVTFTVTDASGFYLFENLPPGMYVVTVTDPVGFVPTISGAGTSVSDSATGSATSSALTVDGDSDLTLDFGFVVPMVSVGDFVWLDTNRDGIQGAFESGIAGVTVSITTSTGDAVTNVFGQPVTSTVTDANGFYAFENLPVGSYTVTVVTPDGLVPTITGAGTPDKDSSSGSATSANLTTDGSSDMTLDFGFVAPMVSVGNFVWFDTNGDGIQSLGEPGLAGVTVSITTSTGGAVTDVFGQPVTSTVTDANGFYAFENLPVGSYTVTVTNPDGLVPTIAGVGTPDKDSSTGSATSANLTTDGSSDLTLDFGFVAPKVSVGDFVWFDTNRDGIQSDGEPGIAGVTVSIATADGSPVTNVFGQLVTSTVTDADGFYVFENLPVGSYTVTVTNPDGLVPTITGAGTPDKDSSTGSATSASLTTDGSSDMTLDFGFVAPKVSVGNFVWLDTDRDGIQDDGEPGLAGVTVSITTSTGDPVTNVLGQPVTSTVTDANGFYVFENLPVGSYTVTVVTPDGYIATLEVAGSDRGADSSTGSATSADLTTDGSSDMTLDFGFVLPRVSVGDLVWLDTNRDGIRDIGEPGLAGVTVSITTADGLPVTDVFGNPVTSTVTDANGFYVFENLPVGSYTVTVVTPDGYIATLEAVGSDRGADSSTGSATSADLLNDGSSDRTLDFGFVLPMVSVGDFVWFDLNNDGIQGDDEPGLAGVTLSISKADGSAVTDVFGQPVTTTVTDANGLYVFENLPVGSYKVTVTDPSGMVPTVTGAGTSDKDSSTGFAMSANLTVDGSSDMTLDFGFWAPPASVGSRVWSDLDGDGIQDPGEPGIAGVQLMIRTVTGSAVVDIDGETVADVFTDADGNYLFTNLPLDAQYVVMVVSSLPDYVQSPAEVGDDRGLDSSTGQATSLVLGVSQLLDLSLDFGYVPMVSVGDFVWLDTNRDGIQNLGEPGIAGVTVSITTAAGLPVTDVFGQPVTSTVTDANGFYVFENLPVGSYTVTVVTPDGLVPTITGAGTPDKDSSTGSATSVNLTSAGSSDLTLDFGFVVPMVSVGDFVWLDTDRDGIQDDGEPGIAGVTLTISTSTGGAVTDVFGNAVTTTTTDESGFYLFENLPPGTYVVTVTDPVGLVPTVPGDGSSELDSSTGSATSSALTADGDADLTLDFGFVVPMVSVGDFVWLDTDRDGVQDAGEPGLAGVTLSITTSTGGAVTDVFGNPVTTTVTDANGFYLFANLPPGTYVVTVTDPVGLIPTIAGEGAVDKDSSTGSATSSALTVNGDSDTTLDFGFVVPMVSVGDFVWLDTDRDGIQDDGEPGIAGVTLTITTSTGGAVTDVFGNSVTTTTTDANGFYLFENLPPGTYVVTVTDPVGFIPTITGAGALDKDSSTGSATSSALTVNGDADLTLDFGFVVPMVSVGDFVWLDTDRDGIQTAGEPGISLV